MVKAKGGARKVAAKSAELNHKLDAAADPVLERWRESAFSGVVGVAIAAGLIGGGWWLRGLIGGC